MTRLPRPILSVALSILPGVSCAPSADPPARAIAFLRGALFVPGPGSGQPVPGGQILERAWQPGETIRVGVHEGVAPRQPECHELFSVDLGEAPMSLAKGGEPPDACVAWSPDGNRLAIGSAHGDVLVVESATGRVISRRHFPEAVVKEVAWAPDGRTVYMGEQSPDAMLRALKAEDLATTWSRRLADDVETSAPPARDDLYGVYTLPAVYGLEVLRDGSLLVAAVHAWNEGTGPDGRVSRKNQSRLFVLDDRGTTRSAWPADGPADATLMHPRVDEGPADVEDVTGLVAVPVGRSANGPAPTNLPINGAALLSLPHLEPVGEFRASPLEPYFDSVFAWDAVDVDAASRTVLMGLGDGRVFQFAGSGDPARTDLGTPVVAGGVPLAASVGFGFFAGDGALVLTSRTNIPYGSASPALRPPTVHPAENTLFALDRAGRTRWSWRGPPVLTGLALAPDGRTLAVGAGPRATDERTDLFGALVFGLGPDEGDLLAFCQADSPANFRMAFSKDGFLALPTHPWVTADGHLRGRYAVHVFR